MITGITTALVLQVLLKHGTRTTDPNYDGINVYGDETTVDIQSNVLNPLAQQAPFYAPYVNALPASIPVSRTGYTRERYCKSKYS